MERRPSPGSFLISRGEVAVHEAKRSAVEHEGDSHSPLVSCQRQQEGGLRHPWRPPNFPSAPEAVVGRPSHSQRPQAEAGRPLNTSPPFPGAAQGMRSPSEWPESLCLCEQSPWRSQGIPGLKLKDPQIPNRISAEGTLGHKPRSLGAMTAPPRTSCVTLDRSLATLGLDIFWFF